jgi:large subunit ribosomal protein L24
MKEYSRQPRKQRLANYNRNQHAQMRAMSAHLSDELLKEYGLVRSFTVRKGDTVKIVRGIFKGHVAKVVKAFPQKGFISIDEATLTKADGKKVARMFRPSNVILTKLDLTDPWRREKLSRYRTPGGSAAAEQEADLKKEAEKIEEAADKKEAAEEKKALEEAGEAEALAEEEERDKPEKPERSEGPAKVEKKEIKVKKEESK